MLLYQVSRFYSTCSLYKYLKFLLQVVFLVVYAVIGGAKMIGFSFAFTSDFNRGAVAGGRIMALLDRRPAIDSNPATGVCLPRVAGNLALANAEFFYELR